MPSIFTADQMCWKQNERDQLVKGHCSYILPSSHQLHCRLAALSELPPLLPCSSQGSASQGGWKLTDLNSGLNKEATKTHFSSTWTAGMLCLRTCHCVLIKGITWTHHIFLKLAESKYNMKEKKSLMTEEVKKSCTSQKQGTVLKWQIKKL